MRVWRTAAMPPPALTVAASTLARRAMVWRVVGRIPD